MAFHSFTINDFYCTECGNRGISLPRHKSKQREVGHLKKIYCIYCQKETNHAEIKPFGPYSYASFKEEFELGRFVDGVKTPVAELPSCSVPQCKYNKSGKCWNSNGSYKCDKRGEESCQED